MEVILLERVAKLGQMGEVVRVKDGFARNFLLPKGKALRATDANRAKFETMKVDLQAKNLATKAEAEKISSKLDGKSFPVLRQASETGQLYGSVSPRDLADLLNANGFEVDRNQIALNVPIKLIGQHKVPVLLHPELEVTITVNVARNPDEAERLAKGENVTIRREGGADEEEAEAAKAAKAAAEAVFEPDAADAEGESAEAAPAEAEAKPAEVEAEGQRQGQGREGRIVRALSRRCRTAAAVARAVEAAVPPPAQAEPRPQPQPWAADGRAGCAAWAEAWRARPRPEPPRQAPAGLPQALRRRPTAPQRVPVGGLVPCCCCCCWRGVRASFGPGAGSGPNQDGPSAAPPGPLGPPRGLVARAARGSGCAGPAGSRSR